MEAKFLRVGSKIHHTTAADIAAGDVVVIGGIAGVAERDIANGATGDVTVEGVFEVLKDDSVFAAGDLVFWNPAGTPVGGTATGAASKVASAGVPMGICEAAAVTGATTVVVKLTPHPDGDGIGASTAAAGTTSANAGVLPAGTARIYPTTAADDTTGVRIDAADKVSGRTLFIGNGVANKILKVYPPSGGTINGAAADAAFSSASGKGVIAVCLSAANNTWLAW